MSAAPRQSPPLNPPGSSLATREGQLPAGVETASVAAAAQAKTAIEARYMMALHRPRDWKVVREKILVACDRPRFAEAARYVLPRGQKEIDGLSIRFAEEVVRWIGNVMVEAVVTFEDDERRILRVVATDLEANVTYPFDVVIEKFVERKSPIDRDVISVRTNSQNQKVYRVRATEDEILMKQNSLASKAMRNGVLRLLPADMQEEALERVKATQAGMSKDRGNVERLVRAFAAIEVTQAMIEDVLGHGIGEMTPDEFALLSATGQGIKDGETSWQAFSEHYLRQTKRDRPTARPVNPVRSGDYGSEQSTKAPAAETIHMDEKPLPAGSEQTGYPPEETEPTAQQRAQAELRRSMNQAEAQEGQPSHGPPPIRRAKTPTRDDPQRSVGAPGVPGDLDEDLTDAEIDAEILRREGQA